MARAPTKNSPIAIDANGCGAVSHASPDTPCAAPASTSDVGGGQQRSPSAAQLGVASSLGNMAGAGVSVYVVAQVDASSSAISNPDTSRAPTAMTPLSHAAATSSTNRSSPTITSTAIATPGAPVVALGLPPAPQDSDGSRDQRPAAGQSPGRAQDKPQNRDHPSREFPGGQGVEIGPKGRDGQGQNRQGDGKRRKGKGGNGKKGQDRQRDNLAQTTGRSRRQGSSSVIESPSSQSMESTSSASSARPVPSRTSTPRSKSFLSKSTYTSVEPTSQSSDQVRQSPPAPQTAQSEENQNLPPSQSVLPTSFLSTSTSTTVERPSQSAPAPQRAQNTEKQNHSPPQNGQAPSSIAQGQGPAPTNEALNPQLEATQSQDSGQVPSAPTFAEPAPSDSSAPTPSPAPRLNPEINLGLLDDPVSQTTTVPNAAGSTDSQDGLVSAPSKTLDTVPVAIPVETPTSSESPSPSSVLGDTGPDSRIPPPNFIPLGGNPKGLGDSGGVPGTNPAPGQSSQASRGLPTAGAVGISVGGFAAILLIGLALWLWRKSVAKRRDDRSSGPFDEGAHKLGKASEKNGGAAGAQTGTEKLASSLGLFKGGSKSRAAVAGNPKASTNRDTSLFWNMPIAPRDDGALAPPISNGLTVKDRVVDWWTRKAEEIDFDTRVRAGQRGSLDGGTSRQGSVVRGPTEYGPQLDLKLDRSGNLDPFSDNNASFYSAAYATQIPRVSPLNPFSDPAQRTFSTDQSPAIPPRAHGRSQSAVVRDSYYPPRSMAFRPDSGFRESLQSVTPFAERRNKGRSDPFDLEIESRLIPSADDIAQMPRLTGMSSTYSYHTRGASLPYSQYSSGVSLSDWSIMGADLGPATGPTMGEQGRPSEPAEWPGDKGRPQGGGGFGRAV